MFENTGNDLAQCVGAMEAAESMQELDLSPYEHTAFIRMRKLCKLFLEAANYLDPEEV
jgi:hypothetical protein